VNWLASSLDDWSKTSYGNSWIVLVFLVAFILLPTLFLAFSKPKKPKAKKKRP
jgi:hypothetical protein